MSERSPLVVVSAGFHKTHVTTAARAASDRGMLALAITGAYPTERTKRILRRLRLANKGRVARLLERDEAIPASRLRALFVPEILDEIARLVSRIPYLGRFYGAFGVATWRLYGRSAARNLGRASGASIYQFRAGFGHTSIDRARDAGMLVLCDHAIAHPSLLKELVNNRGQLAPPDGRSAPAPLDDPFERAILDDINRSDAVVVNSEFVKETFLELGWAPDRIHVVYLGVDDNFLRDVPSTTRQAVPGGRLRLLFAGRFERRKGADALVDALQELSDTDWELVVAGPITSDVRAEHRAFLEDDRVTLLGTVRRSELATQMIEAPVFVFPSYAEGSARVVFEALACGCYVITTANSGTIVEEGVHGALVAPGDADALRKAIQTADDDRHTIARIGRQNADLIVGRYRQVDYADALAELYIKLVATDI